MYKLRFAIIFVLCNVFLFASHAKAQENEIDKIIKEVSTDSQRGAISSYTYLMKFSYDQHRKFAGRKIKRLYEAILPSRLLTSRTFRHPLVLLEDSERTISGVEIMNSRKALVKDIEKFEEEADKQTVDDNLTEDGGYWTGEFTTDGQGYRIDVLKMLNKVSFSNLQRRQIGGKSVISIDFAPKPDVALGKSLSYLSKIEGQILIDETDKRIISIEGFAPGEFVKQKDKSDIERRGELVLHYLQTKVAEGFWFPQIVRLNFSKLPKGFSSTEVQFDFTNYNRSRVDVDVVQDQKNSDQQNNKPKTEEKTETKKVLGNP